jgi:MULE transposase-like protein
LESLGREFLLDLSTGYVYDVLHDHAADLDMSQHRRTVLEHFSGTLCVDELHLGRFTLLLATDPLTDLPVAFALVDANDQDHMSRFLKNLKNWGLNPQVVVTDGSNLYPSVLAELWSDAKHQLCVFHVMYAFTGWNRLFCGVSVMFDSRKTSKLQLSDSRKPLVFSHPDS